MVFAITEDKEVFVWGGGGVGPTGIPVKLQSKYIQTDSFMVPQVCIFYI